MAKITEIEKWNLKLKHNNQVCGEKELNRIDIITTSCLHTFNEPEKKMFFEFVIKLIKVIKFLFE